jgi:uncharacterized protein YaiE (UPF0345 family)
MGVRHRTYFEGSVQSLELQTAAGRATVGVVEPGVFHFGADDEERIQVVVGTMRIRRPQVPAWTEYGPGDICVIAAGSQFDVEAREHVAYICYYGSRDAKAQTAPNG